MKIITIVVVWGFYWSCIFASGPQPPEMVWFDVIHGTGFFKNKFVKSTKKADDLLSCAALCGKVFK